MFNILHPIVSSIPFSGFLAQAEGQVSTDAGGMGIIGLIIYLAIVAAAIAGIWKLFEKAGQPGWAAIVPIYNLVVLLKISGKPLWWIILFFIPFVNFVAIILAMLGLAKNFGKGAGYAMGCVFLGFIFLPMLGFGDAKYVGPPALN